MSKLYLRIKWWLIDKFVESPWRCRRCRADVKKGRCQCSTSPSPWERKL